MITDLTPLSRCIAVAIGKGGAGKTSLTANVAGVAADAGYRVLVISLDPQDNLGEDLGYASVDGSDDGQMLVAAITGREPLRPIKDVRQGLDVVSGGDALEELVADLYIQRHLGRDEAYALGLAHALLPVAEDYDLILIDCPPGYHILQHLALVASRWILVPTAADASSRKGIARLAQRVQTARELNPDLALLGVVIFDLPTNATRVRATAAQAIARDLGSDQAMLAGSVRTAKAAAADARERGQLMHELARVLDQEGPWYLRKAQNMTSVNLARSAKHVADDYAGLTREILTKLADLEQEH